LLSGHARKYVNDRRLYGRNYGNDFQAMYENMLMTVGYGRNYGNGRRLKETAT